MKPTVMDGEKSPTVVVQTPVVEQPPAPQSNVKKYVIVGVTVVLVTALLTAGLVTTGLLLSKTNSELIKSSMAIKDALGRDVVEDIEADLEHNTATFTVEGEDGKVTTIHDYNKKLSVVVYHEAKEPHCVVHFLNTTNSASDEIVDVNKPNQFKKSTNVSLERDVERVVDVTFLPAQAQTLCEGKDTYWATERYGEEMDVQGSGGRMKRALYLCRYSYSICYGWPRRCVHVYRCWRIY